MNTIVEEPPEDGTQDLNLVDTTGWTTQTSQDLPNNNSTYLYIAVEYVKDEFKMEPTVNLAPSQDRFTEFDQHVSPLDPNMSSVARYSPVYSEPSTEYNPIVIHQLVQPDSSQNDIINNLTPNSSLEAMPVLCNNDIRDVVENQFLQMVNTNAESVNQGDASGADLQIMPQNDQEVALLITDQQTGISYTVKSQEFLDEQLLNALSPEQLLDPHLLTLDENTLKTELSEDIINSTVSVNNYLSSLVANDLKSVVDNENDQFNKMETRRQRQNDENDQLLPPVYSIIDKPVLSRARATLPESYLVINKLDDGCGIFAKKNIAKSTQFGPLTGIIKDFNPNEVNPDQVQYLIENEVGDVKRLDVSDENIANWMSFVRKATNYQEQNLLISQEGNSLYFTTTKNVVPKQELKVGYCATYAKRHKLQVFLPPIDKSWPCFECNAMFATSDELQKHLNVHDDDKNENTKPRKKHLKNTKRKINKTLNETMKCNDCNELFVHPDKVTLRQHLIEKHTGSRLDLMDQYFSFVLNYKCEECKLIFNFESLLKIHNYQHDSDNSEEQTNHICPSCQRKFPTQRQLVAHVGTHALQSPKQSKNEDYKCTVCHKIFALKDRLRRHMMVHGSDEYKPLECKTCKKRFLNNSALAGHLKTHFVGKKVFECPICKEGFDHVLKLKLHVPKHCENNLYSCPHCTKVFKKYSIIRKHIRAFHCDQKHSCQHCSKLFPTLDKLKMHLLRHSDHREFLCADCGKQFKRKDKLNEHCKRVHSEERENASPKPKKDYNPVKKSTKTEPTDFHRFIYKCHTCLVGFKRRGMLVNHLAKRHPDISPESVPELNLPILQTTRDYYCQHCDKVYKSSSKRKAHILKNHPGAALPMSNRKHGNYSDANGLPNPTFSQTVGSVTTRPQSCKWCHKQYASKAKLLQHQRKKHKDELEGQEAERQDLAKKFNDSNEESFKGFKGYKGGSMAIEEIFVEEHCLPDNYKITEVDILNSTLDEQQFCHRDGSHDPLSLTIADGGDGFVQNGDLNNPSSNLYRLLTTSSGLVPPR